MPIPTWTATQFAQYYSCPDRDPASPTNGQRLPYGRKWAQQVMAPNTSGIEFFDQRWGRFASLGIQTLDRVLVVGCGMGFLVEAAHAAGFPNVYGIDYSSYATQSADVGSGIIIVEADIRGGGSMRAQLRSATGDDQFNWIITEDVATSYADADVQAMDGPLRAALLNGVPASHIVHFVTQIPEGGVANPTFPDMNWKTLADWAALLPTHTWMGHQGTLIQPGP